MSTVIKVILAISLALTLSLAAFGCGEGELTQEDIESIVADAAAANAAVNTVSFDMEMEMFMDAVTQDGSVQMTMVADGTGAIDQANQKLKMTMNMDMDIPELGQEGMTMEMYATGGWMYMKMDIPGLGEQWVKMPMTEDMWQSQSQFEQQIELLRTAREVTFHGSENVNGTDCYVVEIVPDMTVIFEIMSQQQMPGMEDMGIDGLDMADWFKKMTVKVWIAKDSYLEIKSDIHMTMEVTAADVGASQDDLEKMTMDMNMTMTMHDYNEEVSIELPAGAQQAMEIPGM
jgi:outer membrane lipoprotein-sorting protein